MSHPSRPLFLCVGLLLALPLAGCNPSVTACEAPDSGGAAIPDPSFEESPTKWTLTAGATIDSEKSACEGSHSLRIKLDAGAGSPEVIRSAPLTGITLGDEYEIRYQHRNENCKDADMRVTIGNYNQVVGFEGTLTDWTDAHITTTFWEEPAYIEIHAERQGAASDFQGGEYDNNLMWVDDFTIEKVGTAE